jgi:hypothetical protein
LKLLAAFSSSSAASSYLLPNHPSDLSFFSACANRSWPLAVKSAMVVVGGGGGEGRGEREEGSLARSRARARAAARGAKGMRVWRGGPRSRSLVAQGAEGGDGERERRVEV